MQSTDIVVARPSNPALSEKGRAWQRSVGIANGGSGRRTLAVARNQRESAVLQQLGTDANKLTSAATSDTLRKYPADAVQPDAEMMQDMEMAALAALSMDVDETVYDDDDGLVEAHSTAAKLPAARPLSALDRRERDRILRHAQKSSDVAKSMAEEIRGGDTRKRPSTAVDEPVAPVAAPAKTTLEQSQEISGPGGMLEKTNMVIDKATAQMTERSIYTSHLVMAATMATLQQRAHSTAQAASGQRPHDVPSLTPEWMAFLTRQASPPFRACKNGAACFGMGLQPPPGHPSSALVVFHTPAQWSTYLNSGHLPSDVFTQCVWCLALQYLKFVNVQAAESTSATLMQQAMPFRNPVDTPGGYVAEFCARPMAGSREGVMPYAIRMPMQHQFVPVHHEVKRPEMGERGLVRRDEHGNPLCSLIKVYGYAEIGDVIFRDGQDATAGARRLVPELTTHCEFSDIHHWEYELRALLCTTLFRSFTLRKLHDVVVQQDHADADLSNTGPLRFEQEDLYVQRLVDICLRPLGAAVHLVQRLAVANSWAVRGEAAWAEWALQHGLVLTGCAQTKNTTYKELELAVATGHHVARRGSDAKQMPAVSSHLVLYMFAARIGLSESMQAMLGKESAIASSDVDEKTMINQYTKEVAEALEKFSTAYLPGFALLLMLVRNGRRVDDATLMQGTPAMNGYSTLDALWDGLDISAAEAGEFFRLPSPDYTMDNTWFELMTPVYPDARHSVAHFAKYVRYQTTLLWRPTPVQYLAAHTDAIAVDFLSAGDGDDPEAGVGTGAEKTLRTHPPRALGSIIADPAMVAPEWLTVVLENVGIGCAELCAQMEHEQTSFRETWARFNETLPQAINTAHWVPRRMVHDAVIAQTNRGNFNELTEKWDAGVRAVLARPTKDYTVLLSLVHGVNEALAALKAQTTVLEQLRLGLARLESTAAQENSSTKEAAPAPAPAAAATKRTKGGRGSVPAAGNARERTTTPRRSVTATSSDAAKTEYTRVREIARAIAATSQATQFYQGLDAHEQHVSGWQQTPEVAAAAADPDTHEHLAKRLATKILDPVSARSGAVLFASPEDTYAPPDVAVYRLPGQPAAVANADAYTSNNSADPLRMPPHPSVLLDDSAGDVETPRVKVLPFPLQSVFTARPAFESAYGTWQETVHRLDAAAKQSRPDRKIHITHPELFMLRRAVVYWEQLTHWLHVHAQSHFRLALLALDAPAMPDDAYFYAQTPVILATSTHTKTKNTPSNLYAMSLTSEAPRPTRLDLAEPEALFSAAEEFLPDATTIVYTARLFETNPQGENEARRQSHETRAESDGKGRGGKSGKGKGGKSSKARQQDLPNTTPQYDAWMSFLTRVMPQATFITHGVQAMLRAADIESFMMLILRCLRTTLLSGYRYAATGALDFHTQLEFERLFVHAEDAAARQEWGSQVFGLWRNFIANNDLVVLAAMREYVLCMIDVVPACRDNITRIFRDYQAFRRWIRLCATMMRLDIANNNGTLVNVQSRREETLKGRDPDKGWSVFHTETLPLFATEEFATWIVERVVSIQTQRATWRCVWEYVGEHCIEHIAPEDAQRMLAYVEMIQPGQPFQRHWLRDLCFDAYTVELVHRMFVTYPNVDRRYANYYLYMLPPHALTMLGLFFTLLGQHYIYQVAPLPAEYARQQQLAIRRTFGVPDDDPLPEHLCNAYMCSPLACYELLSPVRGRQNESSKQSGIREDWATGTLFCSTRNKQRNGSSVPYEKVIALQNARRRYASQKEAHDLGKTSLADLQTARNDLVGAADAVGRTVVNNLYAYQCSTTPVLTRAGVGTVIQSIKKRKKRSMRPTEFARCTGCGLNTVFSPSVLSTNGFLCTKCLAVDTAAAANPMCVVCGFNLSETLNKDMLRQHNRRIAGERRALASRFTDPHDIRRQRHLYGVDESFISTDTTPHPVILLDDLTDHRPHVFFVCCQCWVRWMPDAQDYYTRAEFVHAAQTRCDTPAEKFPVSFLESEMRSRGLD